MPTASQVLHSDGLLSVELRSFGEQVRVIDLAGELDRAGVDRVRTPLLEAATGSDGILVADLSELTFIDSSGIHLLVALSHARDGEEGLRLIPSHSPDVTRILELTGISSMARVVEDGAAA